MISDSAEDIILRLLVLYSSARRSMKSWLDTSYESGTGEEIEWSSPEKAWLFSCLVEKQNEIPDHILGPDDLIELRSNLANRPDTYPGALSPPVVEQAEGEACESDESETRSKTEDGEARVATYGAPELEAIGLARHRRK